MNRALLLLLLILAACGSEKGIEIAKPTTFVRYYNGGFDDFAKLVKQTADNGFIILSNGKVDNPFVVNSPISNPFGSKLIKTNEFGDVLWQKTFFTDNNLPTDYGQDLLLLPDGYLLLGTKNLLKIDLNGNDSRIDMKTKISISKFTAIALTNAQNYVINGIASDNSLFLGELDAKSLTWNWINSKLGNSDFTVNKLFVNSNNLAFWCTQLNVNVTTQPPVTKKKIRPVGFSPNSNFATNSIEVGESSSDQTPFDFSRIGNEFLITGATSEIAATSTDISYYRLTETLKLTGPSSIVNLDDGKKVTTAPGQGQVVFQLRGNQTGYSISSTLDGGIIILAGVDATNVPEEGYNPSKKTEYMLIKLDGFGNLLDGWPKYYGSKDDDIGASVIQANDGSLVVLGTALFGNTTTLMLMKTDKDGNIQ